MYADLVHTFVDYQTRVALRAIERLPNADLVMLYIEQPDGSGHQFLLEDPRQPSDFTNPASIGAGQDAAKVARYRAYRETSYKVASRAVQRIVEAVGTDAGGRPKSNIIVVSDHGFETFHTAVNMPAFLASRGFDPAKVRAVTSGPAANVYINLQGREPNGTVGRDEYLLLQEQIASALGALVDANPNYTNGAASIPVFDKVYRRPVPADIDRSLVRSGDERVHRPGLGRRLGAPHGRLQLRRHPEPGRPAAGRRARDHARSSPCPTSTAPTGMTRCCRT